MDEGTKRPDNSEDKGIRTVISLKTISNGRWELVSARLLKRYWRYNLRVVEELKLYKKTGRCKSPGSY
jgi:hypothetical protein